MFFSFKKMAKICLKATEAVLGELAVDLSALLDSV